MHGDGVIVVNLFFVESETLQKKVEIEECVVDLEGFFNELRHFGVARLQSKDERFFIAFNLHSFSEHTLQSLTLCILRQEILLLLLLLLLLLEKTFHLQKLLFSVVQFHGVIEEEQWRVFVQRRFLLLHEKVHLVSPSA